ncbi:hypothetical protein [Bdellovibrio svalbardensis]|uniref:Uncharacterized protein n=1 Tax=Bdellovibrio svalbardensis TaxID=2972972 RepID=A0ABT6DKL8_9BACT|nr:hypothetical protein [Bdellovibrio svalbardensis]MDG0817191.1 hypothetical protein [Bdellovibrio svalbardensis]
MNSSQVLFKNLVALFLLLPLTAPAQSPGPQQKLSSVKIVDGRAIKTSPANESEGKGLNSYLQSVDKLEQKAALNSKSAQALTKSMGGMNSGGGDLCEDRIQVIREDLRKWILDGGPNGLKLPGGLTVAQYSDQMMAQIDSAKISCVGPNDRGFPIMIGKTPKVCRFDQADRGSITCDLSKFNATNESDQYVLIHHEYAGLAQIELPDQADSKYDTSNQISGFLEDVTIKKLVVKPAELKHKGEFCVGRVTSPGYWNYQYYLSCETNDLDLVAQKYILKETNIPKFQEDTRKLVEEKHSITFLSTFANKLDLFSTNADDNTATYCIVQVFPADSRYPHTLICEDGDMESNSLELLTDRLAKNGFTRAGTIANPSKYMFLIKGVQFLIYKKN